MACIYILFSKSKNLFYVGSTRENDATKRLVAHNRSKTRSIKSGCPWIIIYEEQHVNYTDARKRELFLKSGAGRKWVKEKFSSYKKERLLSG